MTAPVLAANPKALLEDGLVADPDALAPVRASMTGHDRGEPQRALDIRVAGGIDLRLFPDRGLDIYGAWYAGLPLHWSSRVGERRGRQEFLTGFGGGLLTTCGLDNVGSASEGHPLHGTFNRLPADHVRWDHTIDDDELVVTVSGVIDDADALTRAVRCRRRITTRTGLRTGTGEVTVVDTVTNRGTSTVPAPMLYHVNLGAPLWAPGATIELDTRRVQPRDQSAADHVASWQIASEPVHGGRERVYEHDFRVPRATIHAAGIELTVSWDETTMPRLHQWVSVEPTCYVLGIEPANCSVLGLAADRVADRLPVLEPGESRRTSLRVSARRTCTAC